MSNAKRSKNGEAEFAIHGELANVLLGMEGTNWNTQISKNNVKTVTVYFHVKQPMVEVGVKK